ncbi:E3 ubiquitin-protein ligase Midline-1-like [Clavelina lepadiformis]|uniref:E3 ubiquitin-protein ligase Midline-1-like n=1 Tax=Clavelina lepadiformis TaxID=159417 RepID=UPI004042E657
MHSTLALSQRITSANPSNHSLEDPRPFPPQTDSFQAQRLSLRKQCIYQHHLQQLQDYPVSGTASIRSLSPRRDYECLAIPEERSYNSYCRSKSQDRCSRPLSPISRVITPSPQPRSLSRGSSKSCQSSSADESGREGASSSGIGLSESSAESSRRASTCSSGTGSSRLTFHSNIFNYPASTCSRDGSLTSRLNLNGSELTVRDVTTKSFNEDTKPEDGDSIIPKRTQSMDSLENELTCPICLDLFHEPVLLPCAHNLCASCVEQLTTSIQTIGNVYKFECPTCREIVYVDGRGVAGLRRNLTLQNIVDGYRRAAATVASSQGMASGIDFDVSSGEESSASNLSTQSDDSLGQSRGRRPRNKDSEARDYPHMTLPKREVNPAENIEVSCQFCEVNPPRLAVKTCVTCRAYYCDRCLRVTHPRKKPFINHKLVPATPGSAGTLSATSKTAPSFVTCIHHPQDTADLYCSACEAGLCKVCGSNAEHANHQVGSLFDWCSTKKADLEGQVAELDKQKSELQTTVENLLEACQQTEANASTQEMKLQAECDILIRIIQERQETISNNIKETKASRLRKLTQQINQARQCLELYGPVTGQANEALQQVNDYAKFVKNAKAASDRVAQVLTSSKQFESRQQELAPPGFYLEFSQEKSILEKLDIMEAPASPRICEELCTQSHDKITIQWRSPDHRHTDSYELQYAIDNSDATWPTKGDGWMIVPNVKECHYTIHGLQTGTRYLFAVKAANKAGWSRSECLPLKTLGVPFAFDSHSMHKKLRLGNHGYTVSREDSSRKSRDHLLSGNTSSLCGVTGNVDIESGRHYWEVVVCQSTHFTLGVAYSNVSRYDWIGKNTSSWCLCRTNEDWSVKHGGKDIPIQMPYPLPKKIGVMLDYDSAMLSFFDGASGRHFHTFRMSTFERGLRPAFSIGNKSLTINTGITIPDHLRLDSRC